MTDRIVAYIDKTIVKISGIKVQGIKPIEVEKLVSERIGRPIRVIGVTSDSLEMDVYGLEPEAILRDNTGIIKAISMVPGLLAADVARIDSAEKAQPVSAEELTRSGGAACPRERRLARQ